MRLRRYGRWAGDPKGVLEDPENCIEAIYPPYENLAGRQCSRKRGYGREGLYCRQHAEKLKTRNQAKE